MNEQETIEKLKEILSDIQSGKITEHGIVMLLGEVDGLHLDAKLLMLGRPDAIGQAFNIYMKQDRQYNRLMTAMFAAYLASNDTEKENFLRSLEIVLPSAGVN